MQSKIKVIYKFEMYLFNIWHLGIYINLHSAGL